LGDYSTDIFWTTSTWFDLLETFIITFTFSLAVYFLGFRPMFPFLSARRRVVLEIRYKIHSEMHGIDYEKIRYEMLGLSIAGLPCVYGWGAGVKTSLFGCRWFRRRSKYVQVSREVTEISKRYASCTSTT